MTQTELLKSNSPMPQKLDNGIPLNLLMSVLKNYKILSHYHLIIVKSQQLKITLLFTITIEQIVTSHYMT